MANKTINFKSDFTVNMTSSAGWGTGFQIRFRTKGTPQKRYYATHDGEGNYVNCYVDENDANTLVVTFDNHRLGIGALLCEITYSIEDSAMPTGIEESVVNETQVTTTIDGTTYNVYLDIDGDDSAVIAYEVPLFEAEAEREAAEAARETAEAARVTAETARETACSTAVASVNAAVALAEEVASHPTYIGDDNYVYEWDSDNDEYVQTEIYVKGEQGETGPQGEQGETGATGPQGPQGNSGYTGAAGELEVVNNLTDGGTTAALSAEMGKELYQDVTELSQNVENLTMMEDDITSELSSYDYRNGYITNDLGWTSKSASTGIKTIFIPCQQGDVFQLVCSASVNYYAILSAIPNTGVTGFTARVQLAQSNNAQTVSITQSDATYFAIRADGSAGSTYAPTSIIKLSPIKNDVNANKANISELQTDVSNNLSNIGCRRKIVLPGPITLKGWIHNTTLKWASRTDQTYFTIVPVIPGKRMHWIYSGTNLFHYAWLTDFDMIGQKNVTAGGNPSFVTGTSLAWTDNIDDDNVIVPDTANYLYVLHSYDGKVNRLPTMYWIDMAGDMEVNDVYAKLRGKKVSFLGDSITSFYDMPYEGAGDVWAYPNFSERGIMDYSQCWFGRLVGRTGMTLLRNASWKGSTCCGNSLNTSWITGCSTARVSQLSDGVSQPDIVMVFIGINDWIQDYTLGTFNPRSLVPEDGNLTTFVDAYMKMIAKIQATYTKARIFCCTLMATAHDTHDPDQIYPDINDNGVSLYEFNQVIRQIADAMGADVIELSRCGLHFDNLSYYADDDLIHPNSLGMELVANKAEAELLAKY